jgi:hypothetical protein
MDKFRFGLRRSGADAGHSLVHSGANPRSMGSEPVRWCEQAGSRANNSNHNSGPASGFDRNDDEVILADFDRDDAPNAARESADSAGLDWPNSSSWPSSTPGMANTWPMGNNQHDILPGTVNSGEESPGPRQPIHPVTNSRAPLAPVSNALSPRSGPSSGGPLAPLTVRPVPAPVPNLVAALPGSITSTPAREHQHREHREPHQPTVCAPSGGPRRNKRIVYSDPVVQWGFRGPAIKSAVR